MTKALEVRNADLPTMTVASVVGFGKEPEPEALRLMKEYAGRISVEVASPEHPTYGFNNPDPQPGIEEYGYELWMRVEPGTMAEEPIKIKEIPAASYVVTRLAGVSNIGRVWQELGAWYDDKYADAAPSKHYGYESLQTPNEPDPEKWVFDLYMIVETE
jgi:predicted transcriptional regulator YdeE